jgi:hypothetical protein
MLSPGSVERLKFAPHVHSLKHLTDVGASNAPLAAMPPSKKTSQCFYRAAKSGAVRRRDSRTLVVCHPAVISKSSKKRWIPADVVQNTAEYSGSVEGLVSFRGVSSEWQDAVSDAVGFLNGRCWTQLEEERGSPLWWSLCFDRPRAVARCALLCLGRRLETLTWRYVADQLDFTLQLLGENNAVLTTLSLAEYRDPYRHCEQTADVSRLQSRGALQSCRALKQLVLARTDVTDAGIRGLELIHTLEVLNLQGCTQITDVSCLRSCRALKKLVLTGQQRHRYKDSRSRAYSHAGGT